MTGSPEPDWERDPDGNVQCINFCPVGNHCPFGIARVLCYRVAAPQPTQEDGS